MNARARVRMSSLDDDVDGRPELARELDGVAAAELEVPGVGDPAAERVDVAELGAAAMRGGMIPCMRTVHVEPPAELGTRDGLAYALFLPDGDSAGGVVIVHGAGSQKENQFDFARALRAAGVAAVCFDQRGPRREQGRPWRECARRRGHDRRAAAAGAGGAARLEHGRLHGADGEHADGRRRGRRDLPGHARPAASAACASSASRFARTAKALTALLEASDEAAAAAALGERLLLLHAEGDEQVPVESSRELHAAAPGSRLVTVPGGHHQSIQHDGEMVALVVRFLTRALRPHPAPQ